jgi:hypothetical protein
MIVARRFCLAFATSSVLFFPSIAYAISKDACYKAFEHGQRLRKNRQYLEASDEFALCSRRECPSTVQKPCETWTTDLESVTPTITLSAIDENGKDLIDVEVSIDGRVMARKLDGQALRLNPGAHSVRFVSKGRADMLEKILVKEGDRARPIVASWKSSKVIASDKDPANPPAKEQKAGSSEAPTEPKSQTIDVHSTSKGSTNIPPLVVAGVGAVFAVTGVVFLAASSVPRECTYDLWDWFGQGTCTPNTDELKSKAAVGAFLARAGTVSLIAGSVATIGGLVWFLLVPKTSGENPPKTASGFRPWIGPGQAGIVGSF